MGIIDMTIAASKIPHGTETLFHFKNTSQSVTSNEEGLPKLDTFKPTKPPQEGFGLLAMGIGGGPPPPAPPDPSLPCNVLFFGGGGGAGFFFAAAAAPAPTPPDGGGITPVCCVGGYEGDAGCCRCCCHEGTGGGWGCPTGAGEDEPVPRREKRCCSSFNWLGWPCVVEGVSVLLLLPLPIPKPGTETPAWPRRLTACWFKEEEGGLGALGWVASP